MEVNMNQATEVHEDPGSKKKAHSIKIQIDRVHYDVENSEMTGAQIRQVAVPPIGPDRDLFEVVPGASDLKIGDATLVQLHNGMRFFTAPGQINPGSFK
jgi:hypothetical protein